MCDDGNADDHDACRNYCAIGTIGTLAVSSSMTTDSDGSRFGATPAARDGLERLARYGARPPFAHRRLRVTASGQVAYRLRRPWFTGQTELVLALAPVAFLRRLAALIPPPRQNQIRYHGVFAAHAKLRAGVTALVPGAPRPPDDPPHPVAIDDNPHPHREACPGRATSRPPSRLPWAELLRRVFREDLLVCPRCTGTMQVLATITDPTVVVAILTHLGAPTAPRSEVRPPSGLAGGRPRLHVVVRPGPHVAPRWKAQSLSRIPEGNLQGLCFCEPDPARG